MTESKWLACREPSLMLEFLEGKLRDRKLRLFACACWRNVWELLIQTDRELVEINEAYADGLEVTGRLFRALSREERLVELSPAPVSRADAERNAAEARSHAGSVACAGAETEREEVGLWKQVTYREARKQCELLRCLVGNPFRPVSGPEAWRTWNDGMLVKMARSIYDSRRWNEMPILADALEDAGCTDVLLLDHCRKPGEHTRGCHVLDTLLDLA